MVLVRDGKLIDDGLRIGDEQWIDETPISKINGKLEGLYCQLARTSHEDVLRLKAIHRVLGITIEKIEAL